MEKTTIIGTPDDIGRRLDVVISEKESLTRSYVQKLAEDGYLLVNGVSVAKNYKIRENDQIEIEYPAPTPCHAEAEDIPIEIIYEDEDLLVVNKPKGMVVHPAAGNPAGTLVNALLHHCKGDLSGIGGVIRPGIVHRIDKDTSGLLLVAKNDTAHLFLSEEIKFHRVSRIYHALAIGHIDGAMTLDYPIGRHPVHRQKMAVTDKNAKPAITHVEVLESFSALTYIRCTLETGRTHQIRVHLSHIGHPLLGDLVYGSEKLPANQKFSKWTSGQCLHAKEISFTHPRTGLPMHFSCSLPDYFEHILDILSAQKHN